MTNQGLVQDFFGKVEGGGGGGGVVGKGGCVDVSCNNYKKTTTK